MNELQKLFESILWLATEGRSKSKLTELLALIARDATKGIEIAKQQPGIDELKALTRKLRVCFPGCVKISIEAWAHADGSDEVDYWIARKGFTGIHLNTWPEVQQAVEWFVACSYVPQNVSVYASGTE